MPTTSSPTIISPSTEQPIYILHQNRARALLPKVGTLMVLSAIFYLGILLNIALLQFDAPQETTVKTAALIFLLAVIVFSTIVAVHRSGRPYLFYRNRIMQGHKTILLQEIEHIIPLRDVADRMFRTEHFALGKTMVLRNIPVELQLQQYLQQLQAYARKFAPVQPTQNITPPAAGTLQ